MNRIPACQKLFVAVALFVSAACTAQSGSTGVASMKLEGTGASGQIYRLTNATFTVTGTDGRTEVISEDDPSVAEIVTTLPVGDYEILLEEGWELVRFDPDTATSTVVSARLTSANPTSFTIAEGATTDVVFAFTTEDGPVETGEGDLRIGIDVDDSEGPTPGELLLSFEIPISANAVDMDAGSDVVAILTEREVAWGGLDGTVEAIQTLSGMAPRQVFVAEALGVEGIGVLGVAGDGTPMFRAFDRASGSLLLDQRYPALTGAGLVGTEIEDGFVLASHSDAGVTVVGLDRMLGERFRTVLGPAEDIAIAPARALGLSGVAVVRLDAGEIVAHGIDASGTQFGSESFATSGTRVFAAQGETGRLWVAAVESGGARTQLVSVGVLSDDEALTLEGVGVTDLAPTADGGVAVAGRSTSMGTRAFVGVVGSDVSQRWIDVVTAHTRTVAVATLEDGRVATVVEPDTTIRVYAN